jgi:hypothetical protein
MSAFLPRVALTAVFAGLVMGPHAAAAQDVDDDFVLRSQTIAQRLGGADGIAAFISAKVVPALVASELGPFFTGGVTRLTESTSQTVQCLARLLDHDLGGSSPKNGAIVTDASAPPAFPAQHQCRSSMSGVHQGMHISDAQFDLFVSIVAREALSAGVQPDDVAAVGKVLGRYRGNITNK